MLLTLYQTFRILGSGELVDESLSQSQCVVASNQCKVLNSTSRALDPQDHLRTSAMIILPTGCKTRSGRVADGLEKRVCCKLLGDRADGGGPYS